MKIRILPNPNSRLWLDIEVDGVGFVTFNLSARHCQDHPNIKLHFRKVEDHPLWFCSHKDHMGFVK